MKKFVSVIFILFFVINYLQAQPAEKLTNSTIIKMVKAKLSDDLIIGEINNSEVNFNVSPDSIKYLSAENVSSPVIGAMKAANDKQTPAAPMEVITQANATEPEKLIATDKESSLEPATIQLNDTVKQPKPDELLTIQKDTTQQDAVIQANDTIMKPETVQTPIRKEEASVQPEIVQLTDSVKQPNNEKLKSETLPSPEIPKKDLKSERGTDNLNKESASTVSAMSYISPITELILFFDQEITSMSGIIQGWDLRIRKSLESGKQIRDGISELEKELIQKKNANSKGFTPEINSLKANLSKQRESLKLWNTNMFMDGANITKELKSLSNKTNQSIDEKFSSVSRLVSAFDPDPTKVDNMKTIKLPNQKYKDNIVAYIAPAGEMLICYQNEILSLKDIILLRNEDVVAVNKKDSELSNQLEPLKKELINYQLTPKKYKSEISGLKKQISLIEKDRKLLDKKMGNDSKELSKHLNQMCKEVQASVNERYSDIIENINYSYQDNLSGFKNTKE